MKSTFTKKYPSIACCGIDCGLCPRYYTKGPSKCPGCGGPDFSRKHPSCSILTCSLKKHGFETCADCTQFPCEKLEPWDKADSFVTHRVCLQNLNEIKQNGIETFLVQQGTRIEILEMLLNSYNEGRSKSLFCLATTLLSIEDLNDAIAGVKKKIAKENVKSTDLKTKSKLIKEAFNQYASSKNIDLKLRKTTKSIHTS